MALILRQSTAVVVSFGPFVDKTDGVTPETGLVSAIDHATTGILLSKNGGVLTIRSQAVTASTYDAYAMYRVTLSTTDTNTVGTLRMAFIETATCLPVWQDFQVVEEEVYDDLYAASAVGYLKPTTAGRDLDVSAGGEAGVDWANIGSPTTIVGLSGTTVKEVTDVETKLGTPAGASVSADIAVIEAQTDDIGVAGAGLTAVPWNVAWDAEVQSEVDDALVAQRVDELVGASAGGVDPVAGSIMDQVMNKDAGQTFSPATDSLEAVRDALPGAAPTAAVVADAVWDEALADHVSAGSTGAKVDTLPGPTFKH